LDDWLADLQMEIERLLENGQLTQEQSDELVGYYEKEMADIRADAEAGGITAFDKTDDGLMEVYYPVEQLSYEPPAIDILLESYISKNRTLGIATILPTN